MFKVSECNKILETNSMNKGEKNSKELVADFMRKAKQIEYLISILPPNLGASLNISKNTCSIFFDSNELFSLSASTLAPTKGNGSETLGVMVSTIQVKFLKEARWRAGSNHLNSLISNFEDVDPVVVGSTGGLCKAMFASVLKFHATCGRCRCGNDNVGSKNLKSADGLRGRRIKPKGQRSKGREQRREKIKMIQLQRKKMKVYLMSLQEKKRNSKA
ncbi:hypothetical protein BY996DRAFT_6410129 [Phakopsora pachyrhizi]|nr:hypothetical protein BY996DRAFT_6410129 [Phakopsora pachyrhizi]